MPRLDAAPLEASPQWQALEALRASGERVFDLTLSNPTLAGLPYPAALPGLLASPGAMTYKPAPKGDAAARQAISQYYRGQGRACDPEDLLLTASTSEAYAFLFKLLCDPGDEILIPSPTYPLFDSLAELEHVNLVRYPLRQNEGKWRADFAFLNNVISTRSRALILVHPNNPTGHLADPEEIRAYLALAADHDLALIVDEVFCDYVLGSGRHAPIASEGPLVFTLNGLSKSLALPQLKLGWIHAAGAAKKKAAALSHLEWIADAYLSVNTPVQAACPALLALRREIQAPLLARLKANLATAQALTAGLSHVYLPAPEAGWYALLDLSLPITDETFALDLLKKRHVYAHPGHLFGLEGGCTLVLSLLVREEEFRRGVELILAEAAPLA